MKKPNYYLILEVGELASSKEIKAGYRKLAFIYHPDSNNGNEHFSEKFKEINEAYQVLSDPIKRKAYDLLLNSSAHIPITEELPSVYYLKFKASKIFLKQFEEVVFEFIFPSEGRFFKRQQFNDWFIIAGPDILQSDMVINEIARKETRIKYVLAAVNTGNFLFEAPSVIINNKRVSAEPLYFTVTPQNCAVNKYELASGKPIIVALEKPEVIRTKHFIKTKINKRLVIIPIGKTFKSALFKVKIFSMVATIIFALALMNYLNNKIYLLLAGILFYGFIRMVIARMLNLTFAVELIKGNSDFQRLIKAGYKISLNDWPIYLAFKMYSLIKGK